MKKAMSVDGGLLVLRVGIGIMFILFGWPKISGGPDTWAGLGKAMGSVGISFAPVVWGFLAAVAEFCGGIALVFGVLVRPFAALMAATMIVATTMLIRNGQPLQQYAHALDMAIVFVALVAMGGGRYAVGRRIRGLADTWWQ